SAAKRYTFVVKDEILPRDPETGRDQSTVSYEYDFEIDPNNATSILIPWDSLKATYRGKEKEDAPRLHRESIKRFSIMNRSFFGDQEGVFSISIKSISATTNTDVSAAATYPKVAAIAAAGLVLLYVAYSFYRRR
ncbi:hypothetical protein LTR04_002715, partial [Oleoguttula sp. CCFEE 6159]